MLIFDKFNLNRLPSNQKESKDVLINPINTQIKSGALISYFFVTGNYPEELSTAHPIELLKLVYNDKKLAQDFETAIRDLLEEKQKIKSAKTIADIFERLELYTRGEKYDHVGWSDIKEGFEGVLVVFGTPSSLRSVIEEEILRRITIGDIGIMYCLNFDYINFIKYCNNSFLPSLHEFANEIVIKNSLDYDNNLKKLSEYSYEQIKNKPNERNRY